LSLETDADYTVNAHIGERLTTLLTVRHHVLLADEPASFGGLDYGPTPFELLAASVASCTAITVANFARRRKWALPSIDVEVTMVPVEDGHDFAVKLSLPDGLTSEQASRLAAVAIRCPVRRAMQRAFRFHEEFGIAVDLLNKGLVDVKPLISATVPYRDAGRAFALAADRSKAMKVLLDFD